MSADGGKAWHCAELVQSHDQDLEHMWAWTLWSVEIPIPSDLMVNQLDIVCKATDRAYNTQPETANGIWNVRGLINNAWHNVQIRLV